VQDQFSIISSYVKYQDKAILPLFQFAFGIWGLSGGNLFQKTNFISVAALFMWMLMPAVTTQLTLPSCSQRSPEPGSPTSHSTSTKLCLCGERWGRRPALLVVSSSESWLFKTKGRICGGEGREGKGRGKDG